MRRTKTIVIILAINLLCAIQLTAQSNFRVGISMGGILPVNEFKSIDNTNFDAGYSESGFTLNFDGDYYFTRRLAVSARFHFGMTSMNENESYDWLENRLGDYYNEDSVASNIGYWQWSAPLLGVKYNYPIVINKFYFETGIFTGLNITALPLQRMKVIDEENERAIFSENIKQKSYAMPLMIDAGFRLILNEQVQLKIQSSYYTAQNNYQHADYILTKNATAITEELDKFDLNVPIKTINLAVGLVYTL